MATMAAWTHLHTGHGNMITIIDWAQSEKWRTVFLPQSYHCLLDLRPICITGAFFHRTLPPHLILEDWSHWTFGLLLMLLVGGSSSFFQVMVLLFHSDQLTSATLLGPWKTFVHTFGSCLQFEKVMLFITKPLKNGLMGLPPCLQSTGIVKYWYDLFKNWLKKNYFISSWSTHFSKTLWSLNAVVPREGSSSVHFLGNDQNERLKKCVDLFWKFDNPPWSFLDTMLLSLA